MINIMEPNYKYKSLSEFREDNPNDYSWLLSKKLLSQLCEEMGWQQLNKPKGYWNIKENCIEEAKKYNSYNDMNINCKVGTKQILKNGWKYEICELMGWRISPKSRPKGYWDIKENCIEEAKKYSSYPEFNKKQINKVIIESIKKNGWFNEIIELMGWDLKTVPPGYWDIKENCIEEAKKYKTKLEYTRKSKSYRSSVKNGWINEISELRGWRASTKQIQKPANYWNIKENCIEEAKKYSDYTEFRSNSQSAVQACRKNGWLNEIIQLMGWEKPRQQKPNKYWHVKENCIEDARKYNKKTDWYENSPSAVSAAKMNGWYEECTQHIPKYIPKLKTTYWSKERCISEIKKYKTKTEFYKNSSGAYTACVKNGWLRELYILMNWK